MTELFEDGALGVAIEPVRGRDGIWGVALASKSKFFFVQRGDDWNDFTKKLVESCRCVIWDVRRIIDWPLSDDHVVYDMKSIFGGDENLPTIARKMDLGHHEHTRIYEKFLDADQKVVAHARALKTTKIELPTMQAIPPELIREWVKTRAVVVQDLFSRTLLTSAPQGAILSEFENRWPFIRALREMELNGIFVDQQFIKQELKGSADQANKSALRSMDGLCKGGYVTTLYNPMGGKTGRVRHEGGFNALAIPHGASRDAIISRFEGGAIFGFDFNAIDYRCIVNSVGGELAELYAGSNDFHERTASFIFKTVTPASRKAIKFLSYIYIYGGSEDTLVEKTGWTLEQVKQVLELLDRKIAPIKEFRERLWMQAQENKFIVPPGGRKVYLSGDDSPGKVIGLYAQTYSSWVFERAVVSVQKLLRGMKSKLIFTVHDELVIDAHPEEFEQMEMIRQAMQVGGHVVKLKKGRTYGQVE